MSVDDCCSYFLRPFMSWRLDAMIESPKTTRELEEGLEI